MGVRSGGLSEGSYEDSNEIGAAAVYELLVLYQL